MNFTPPAYPYGRLDGLKKIATAFDGGPIDCSIGTPVDAPPDFVMATFATTDARGYPPSAGTVEFRRACAGWLERRFGVTVADDDLATCIGTKEFVGTVAGYLHLARPHHDTVLYPAVSYPTYAMGAALAGLRSVPVALKEGRLDLSSISASDIERALMLWSNSPSNPTGALDDLGAVAAWGRNHGVLVASDECYCEYTWADRPRTILEHGVTGVLALHSASKRSNLAGARAGFYAGDPDVVAYLRSIRQHAGFMVPGPVQAAATAAFGDDEHVLRQRDTYWARLETLAGALEDAGVDAPMPDGTFYLWCHRRGVDGWALATELAERAGLIVSPGEFYGPFATDHVRIAVVQPDERIALAASRLQGR